jgi:hypothetical protein
VAAVADLTRPVGTDGTHETARTLVARRPHECGGYRCSTTIKPGDRYARLVAFPGHEAVGGDQPWAMKLCVACATEHGRPMPPRRGEETGRG